jgi:hypothetical protein
MPSSTLASLILDMVLAGPSQHWFPFKPIARLHRLYSLQVSNQGFNASYSFVSKLRWTSWPVKSFGELRVEALPKLLQIRDQEEWILAQMVKML